MAKRRKAHNESSTQGTKNRSIETAATITRPIAGRAEYLEPDEPDEPEELDDDDP